MLGILSILLLVAATGYFVAAEFALVSIRKTRIEQLLSQGHPGAARIKRAVENLQTYLAVAQVGITMTTLGLGAVSEPVLAELIVPPLEFILPRDFIEAFVSIHGIAIAIAFIIITVLEIILGETVPKIYAIQRAEATLFFVIRPLNLLLLVFKPLVWVINVLGNAVLRLMGLQPNAEFSSVHSVEELEMLVISSRKAGVLEEEEEAILRRVFDLGDLTARQVMLPRTEIDAVPIDATLRDVIDIIAESRHSRFPAYEGDLDNILGVLYVKDVFVVLAQQLTSRDANMEPPPFNVKECMREILKVPETMDVNSLLAEMRQKRIHIAVVIDEYGGTAGIVTLEDLLEEIIGEVRDEFEGAEESADIVSTPDGTLINGLTPIDDVNERLGLKIESEADTVGGYVFEMLGRKPELGDEVSVDGRSMRVERLDGLRISQVRLTQGAKASPATPEDE